MVLLGGGVLLAPSSAAGRARRAAAELDPAERERLRRLLADDTGPGRA